MTTGSFHHIFVSMAWLQAFTRIPKLASPAWQRLVHAGSLVIHPKFRGYLLLSGSAEIAMPATAKPLTVAKTATTASVETTASNMAVAMMVAVHGTVVLATVGAPGSWVDLCALTVTVAPSSRVSSVRLADVQVTLLNNVICLPRPFVLSVI